MLSVIVCEISVLTKLLAAGLVGSWILEFLCNSTMIRPAALIPFWKLGANAMAFAAVDAPISKACTDLITKYNH